MPLHPEFESFQTIFVDLVSLLEWTSESKQMIEAVVLATLAIPQQEEH